MWFLFKSKKCESDDNVNNLTIEELKDKIDDFFLTNVIKFNTKTPENSHKDFSGEYMLRGKFKVTVSYEQSFILLIFNIENPIIKIKCDKISQIINIMFFVRKKTVENLTLNIRKDQTLNSDYNDQVIFSKDNHLIIQIERLAS